jgi:hypothetical protein
MTPMRSMAAPMPMPLPMLTLMPPLPTPPLRAGDPRRRLPANVRF